MKFVACLLPGRLLATLGLLAYCFSSTSIAQKSLTELGATAKCGVAFDKAKFGTVPHPALAIPEMAHEILAANHCINKKNTATACDHYRRAFALLEKMDPAHAGENRADMQAQMKQYGCQ